MKFNDMKQHDANDWKSRLGMVYSTDPDFRYTTDEVEEPETLPPDKQTLRVWLDRKQRAGRVVTLVRGFRGTAADLEALGRMLKQRCGVGGSVKEGEIIVQGDHRDRIVEILNEAGIDIARRTVAKYREALKIPSSIQRRRLLKSA